jgi:outer membrane protein
LRLARQFRALALACLMTSALTTRAAVAADHSLSLNDAIHMALQRNEGLLIERESLAAARAAVRAANGAYDPTLLLEGAWWRSTEPSNSSLLGTSLDSIAPRVESSEGALSIQQLLPTGGSLSIRAKGAREITEDRLALLSPAYRTQFGAELRQPLLRDRATDATRLSVRVAKAGREGAVASLRRSVTETVAAVERAYWSLVYARLAIGVREEAVRLAEEQLEDTQDRVEGGSVARTELAQPRAELERRRGELFGAREALARAENALKLLILDGADDALWAERLIPVEEAPVDVKSVDIAASLERAFADRPELEMADAVLRRRRAETAFAADGIWPTLDAVVSYDRFGFAGTPETTANLPAGLVGDFGDSFEMLRENDFNYTRVALVLGFPIGNRTARGNAAVARHVERQTESDRERVRKTIRAEVLNAAAALETAMQRIEAAQSGREAAEIQLSAERDRYDAGLSTNFLILTRQNDLSRARLDEISALTDYRTARTEMARATGALLEERGVDVGSATR